MAKNRKRKKRKLKRRYGQQDKVVFRQVRREEIQERPETVKERLMEIRGHQQAVRERQEHIRRVYERILPPGMTYSEYMGYIEEKKTEAKEKGAHFRY